MSSMIPVSQIKSNNSVTGDLALDILLKKAREAVERMTPEQKAEMFFEQKVSWVYGEIGIENPDDPRTKDDIRRMIRENLL